MTGAADRRTATVALSAAVLGVAALAGVATGAPAYLAVLLALAGAAVLAALSVRTRVGGVDALVGLGVAASCWDAVRAGGTSLFDGLCAIGVLAVVADLVLRRGATVRWPARACLVAFAGFSLATALVTLFPPDSFYLASRFTLATPATAGEGLTDLGGLARLAVGVIALPIVLGRYARTFAGLVVVGRAFVAGAVVSSVVGLTDYVGATAIGPTLIGYLNSENRSTGLTSQPNHLALTAVMALPFVWLLFRRWLTRATLLLVLLAAIVVSGSRAGLIGAAVALLACAAWRYRARFVLLAAPVGVTLLLAASELLSFTRFGTQGASDSDLERTGVLNQGIDDAVYSPLWGIGLRVSQEAHVVYLQVAASSGLIGLLSFGILFAAALLAAVRLRHHPVALAAGLSTVSYLVVATASNAWLTRYMFVPLAVLSVAATHLTPATGRSAMDSMVPVVETPGVRGR